MRILIAIGVAMIYFGRTESVTSGQTEKRTWYPNGQISEVRHFTHGREAGLQQAWTEDGTLYMNYEMRNGRRYGMFNARPCAPVTEAP